MGVLFDEYLAWDVWNDHFLFLFFVQPRVVFDFLQSEPLIWISFDHSHDKTFCKGRKPLRKVNSHVSDVVIDCLLAFSSFCIIDEWGPACQ